MSEKIFTDTRYFVIYTAFAAILIFFVARKCNNDSDYNYIVLRHLYLNLDFQKESKILEKNLDSNNRNEPYLIFSDKEKFYIDENLYEMVEIGDSISKKKNSTEYHIFKPYKILIYNYSDTSKNLKK